MGRLTRHSPSLFGSHFPAHNCCSFAASLLHIQMDYLRPAAFTLLPFVGSIPGGRMVKANMGWLDSLQLPPWNPPKWVFGPAWAGLYVSMGYSSYLIYRDGGGMQGDAKNALALYGTQLALLDIAACGGCVAGCIVLFKPINVCAAQLLYPYLAWLLYATSINLYTWLKNPAEHDHDI